MNKPDMILWGFLLLRACQFVAERLLAFLNLRYYENRDRQVHAARVLRISEADMAKTLAYSRDKYRFGLVSDSVSFLVTMLFLGLGGLGLAESWAQGLAVQWGVGEITTGLVFFGILALASGLLSLPFDFYYTFGLEQRHGFNRQTVAGFVTDRLKGVVIGVVLLAPLLALVQMIMKGLGPWWWVAAWLVVFGFSLLTAWLYPSLLAPLFNKFEPLPDGELKEAIHRLADQVSFGTSGLYVMDASKRSTHGNAYFTGVFGKKRIVLFDTLTRAMNVREVVAVLAHELGHFKLHHIRWSLVRGFLVTGLMFFLLSLALPWEAPYQAFGLSGPSTYGALILFSLWSGLFGFLLQPLTNYMSRRHEFQADAFALRYTEKATILGDALLKLRETSHVMPIAHPWFSRFYHSHPPILERLAAMHYSGVVDHRP